MGIVLMFAFVVGMVALRGARRVVFRLCGPAVMVLAAAASLLLFSRTGLLAIAAYLAFSGMQRSRSVLLKVVVAFLVVASVMFVFHDEFLREQVAENVEELVVEQFERGGLDRLSGGRISIWQTFPKTVAKHPWVLFLGSGFQNIAAVGSQAMHNNYLHVLIELGLIGLVIYLTWLWHLYWALRRAEVRATDQFGMVLAQEARACFLSILVTMLVGESLYAQPAMASLSGQVVLLLYLAALAPYVIPKHVQESARSAIASRSPGPGIRTGAPTGRP